MNLNIRSKLVLSTVLPVLLVYAVLFWLGVSQVRAHLSADSQQWLLEHARYQATRLALALSQLPALAEDLGDMMLADYDRAQTLLHAHLIDGLRRAPLASAAAIALHSPPRGALLRRGDPTARPLQQDDLGPSDSIPGWQIKGDRLRFRRPIYRRGEPVGESWVEVAVRDVYAELERGRDGTAAFFLSHADGTVLRAGDLAPQLQALAAQLPSDLPTDGVQVFSETPSNTNYWLVNVRLPDSPWRIIAVTDIETALLPARQRAAQMGLVLLFSLAALMAALGLAARRLTRPLETLDASVQQIARGDFSVAPHVTSNDELGDLAQAITRMARHIEDRERQLRISKQVLEQRVKDRTSALLESNNQLTHQIEETRRTEEALRRATEQAQQASRTKSEFLSNMSHELRTPLHGVLGYAQILRRDSQITPSQRESLNAIERCGQHLLTLINQILDLTKIEAGQVRMDIQTTDLRQLVADVRMIIAQRAANKGLELRFDIEPDLPQEVLTDGVKLKQILLNLLGNAVKFTPHGVITLTASLSKDRLVFEVADTGIGIPADKLDRIFDAFHQVQEGPAVDGTGLGLAINQRLIHLLGGESLRVASVPGKGSLFRFAIPYRSAVKSQSPAVPSATAEWPEALADVTAREITAAVDLGDIARLLEVADALSANPAAPRADVENMALMSRMFDFDGLRALSERLQQRSRAQADA